MNTKKVYNVKVIGLIMIAIAMMCYIFAPMVCNPQVEDQVMRYNEDIILSNAGIMPRGEGVVTSDDKYIYYDYMIANDSNRVYTATSYGNNNGALYNACGPVAGTNVVGFYDRWFTNLIPNFSPGAINYGAYQYFPNLNFPAVKSTISNMYSLMETNKYGPGTTQSDFKSGLKKAVNDKGYSLSYSSFYSNAKSVNLNKLSAAISNNKVGIIFLSTYNFVYDICDNSSGTETFVIKSNSTAAHIMMVYGYRIISYYKNGVCFQTDTYLQVSSGYGTAEKGYIKMNDYLNIIEASIVNIS